MKNKEKILTGRWWAVLLSLLAMHCSLFVSEVQAQQLTVTVDSVGKLAK